MRKRPITPIPHDAPHLDEGWLDLDRAAVVEVTSEQRDYPVEAALVAGKLWGWRAADSGTQTIRLVLYQPAKIETHCARLRRNRDKAYPRIRLAMVFGWRAFISRDCSPAVLKSLRLS